jgi:hypothetical protein
MQKGAFRMTMLAILNFVRWGLTCLLNTNLHNKVWEAEIDIEIIYLSYVLDSFGIVFMEIMQSGLKDKIFKITSSQNQQTLASLTSK